MPRKSKKARAAKERFRKLDVDVAQRPGVPGTELVGRQKLSGTGAHGTGWRHKVRRWPTSRVTGRSHKLVIPPPHPDKQVLKVPDSHNHHITDCCGSRRPPCAAQSLPGRMLWKGSSSLQPQSLIRNIWV
ncbi:uncharacterized protein ACNS7B_023651 [Menidia menidia]